MPRRDEFRWRLERMAEFLAAYALHTGRDPREYVLAQVKSALESDEEWHKEVGGETLLSTPGIFRFIFHADGLDRSNLRSQESVYRTVEACLDAALLDPDALMARVRKHWGDSRS